MRRGWESWRVAGCDLNNLTAVAIAVNIDADGCIVEAWDDRPLLVPSPYWRRYWRARIAA